MDPKSPHHKKNSIWWWILTNLGDHFAIYTHIDSLCCTSEINIMLCVSYNPIKKKTAMRVKYIKHAE